MNETTRTYLEQFVALVAVVIAAVGMHRIQPTWSATLGVVAAAVVAATLSVALQRVGLSLRVAALISFAGLFLFTAYGVLSDTIALAIPGWATLRSWTDGVTDGYRALLDSPLPIGTVDDRPAVFLVAITWITGAATAELIGRTRLILVAAIPALALYGFTLAVGAPAPRSSILLPISLALAVLGLLILRRRPPGRIHSPTAPNPPLAPRTLRVGLGLALACALVGWLGATLIARAGGDDDAFDPRDLQDERTVVRSDTNPLLLVKAERSIEPVLPVMTVEPATPGDAGLVDRLSVATLDEYDGTSWKVSADFETSGPTLPATDPVGIETIDVTQNIRIAQLRLPWIPLGPNPVTVSLDGFGYDPAARMAIAPDNDLSPSYALTSRLPLLTEEQLTDAVTTPDPQLVAVPSDVSPAVMELAARIGQGLQPYAQAQAISTFLLDEFSVDVDQPGGHSLGRLESFLLDDRSGTTEQFAAAYALLARLKGLPARVVVGYRLTALVDNEQVGLSDIDTANIDAWAEVRFDDIGWLAFDPTPPVGRSAADDPPAPTTTLATRIIEREVLPTEAGPGQSDIEDTDTTSRGGGLLGPAAAALVVVLLVGALLAVRVAKRNRRHARSSVRDPSERVVSAWYDATDHLVEHGLEVHPRMTFNDVTREGVRSFELAPDSELWELLPAVSAAAYGESAITRADADEAWRRSERFRQELGARRTRLQRLRAWVSVRPFRRPDLAS